MNPSQTTKFLFAFLLAISLCLGPTNAETSMCETNPPPKYSASCAVAPWMWYCKGNEKNSWKLYQKMKSMAATEENLKFYANVLFLPFDEVYGSSYHHGDVLSMMEGYNADLECVKRSLLNAYSSVVYLKSCEAWISLIESKLKPRFDDIAYAATKEALVSIFGEIPGVYTSVYKAFIAVRAMPEIADGLYENVLLCG